MAPGQSRVVNARHAIRSAVIAPIVVSAVALPSAMKTVLTAVLGWWVPSVKSAAMCGPMGAVDVAPSAHHDLPTWAVAICRNNPTLVPKPPCRVQRARPMRRT